ncbi:MAG TPA: DUF433 domain-containing protein [Chloroflexia bacterium]|nr:DUF433 domain-containing protein [Chloroflexia bacterium]
MATTLVDIGTLITRTPGVRGGRPYVIGSGVTVRRIIGRIYKEKLTPEQIVEDMPHLSLAGIYAALAYYHANQIQMDADFAAEEAEEEYLPAESLFSRRANASSPGNHSHSIRSGYSGSGSIPE